MEKRIVKDRMKKRIPVKFGQSAAEKIAFTEDVSPTGLFIKTAYVVRPGNLVRITFEVGTSPVQIEGIVVWAKKVPPNVIRTMHKCGMGIHITKFIEGEDGYQALFS